MESLEESNCPSMSDSFSLYERYMRSFSVVGNRIEDNEREASEAGSSTNSDYDNSNCEGNIDLSAAVHASFVNKHDESAVADNLSRPASIVNVLDKVSSDTNLSGRISHASVAATIHENSSATEQYSLLSEKSDHIEVPVTSEDSKSNCFKHPVFITSTMENSNNAVDSVPLFRGVRPSESVFKLPISELSFIGTLKHVQKLKPIVDPITALSSVKSCLGSLTDKSDESNKDAKAEEMIDLVSDITSNSSKSDPSCDRSSCSSHKESESTGDSQYKEISKKQLNDEESSTNLEQSYSSYEASFDSGVRSPDMFSDEGEQDTQLETEPFWSFLKDFEAYDKKRIRKMEEALSGIPPPPSVTTLKIDVSEMLRKYYCFLPAFNNSANPNDTNVVEEAVTPTKRVSFIEIPQVDLPKQEVINSSKSSLDATTELKKYIKKKEDKPDEDTNNSVLDNSVELNMCTEIEAKEMIWPDLVKCRYYDVYYNVTCHSEKLELLALKYGERCVGAETDTSVNVYSGGMQSPSSASKRKALRLKLAQAKSPGRRLSHLARRRQAFCSAATINEKAQASSAKMVFIDKNFFPHRKLVNSLDRKSPRRRTPGKRTSVRKTPGKMTPAKTPKSRSGGSSKKKAMRRLLMDSNTLSRSQPTRETLKRALFISPENRKPNPSPTCSSVPLQAMKSKRALFGSPVRPAETKSLDGSQSDQFLKRKRDLFDDDPDTNKSKIAKSLSFGGDVLGNSQLSNSFSQSQLNRRASEMFTSRQSAELNEIHKKKLVWAVSEGLRVHGWRMSSAGFSEHARRLARLTRRLLALPAHQAARAAPRRSTSDIMLKLARQYAFAIIQGRSVEECYDEEKARLENEANCKITGYISASAYQQMRSRATAPSTITFASQIKENTFCDSSVKQEQPKSSTKNILQDKLVNIDTNSSSSGLSMLEKPSLYKSNSMPSFEEAAKMRARRQISFDNVEFPKR